MDCSGTNSLFTVTRLWGYLALDLFICGTSSWAKVPPVREISVQSFSDRLVLKKDGGGDIPLSARAYGLFAGYGTCLNIYFKRNCVFASGGAGIGSVVVESGSASYLYRDGGAFFFQGNLGGGVKHYFSRSVSTALVSADIEMRQARYKSPSATYSIREENLSYHFWARAQFSFPISGTVSFYQALLFSPNDKEFAYRIGLSL